MNAVGIAIVIGVILWTTAAVFLIAVVAGAEKAERQNRHNQNHNQQENQ